MESVTPEWWRDTNSPTSCNSPVHVLVVVVVAVAAAAVDVVVVVGTLKSGLKVLLFSLAYN